MSKDLELVKVGYANGVAPGAPFTENEKWAMVEEAAEAYGKFLDALGCDWRNDPNSSDTPRRVAKAYVFDLWKGRYDDMSGITAFPSDGYDGIVQESNIPVESMCSHHHQRIGGRPETPSSTTSGNPPWLVLITGVRAAIASRAAKPKLSVCEGNKKRSEKHKIR